MTQDDDDEFDAEEIALFLEKRGISDADFAEAAGVARTTWQRTVNGKRPHPLTRRAFLDAYRKLQRRKRSVK